MVEKGTLFHPSHYFIIAVLLWCLSEQTIFLIFAICCLLMVPWVVGKSPNLPNFSWHPFGMPYLPPGGLGRSSESLLNHNGGVKVNHFMIFAIFASWWYPGWLKSLPTFLIFHGDHFGMPYLPPGVLGRSSESFLHHNGGVKANHLYDFCNFLRPDGTLGGWKVSQPS